MCRTVKAQKMQIRFEDKLNASNRNMLPTENKLINKVFLQMKPMSAVKHLALPVVIAQLPQSDTCGAACDSFQPLKVFINNG